MKLENEFTVHAPIETAWDTLTDLDVVAPLLPGAQLTGRDGDAYLGKMKVKVGPVTSEFSGRAALTVADFDQAALAGKYLCRQLAAVLAGHCAFDALDDSGDWTAVVLELLGTILHGNSGSAADVFVIRAFVRVLKASPSAHIINEDAGKIGDAILHVLYHLPE